MSGNRREFIKKASLTLLGYTVLRNQVKASPLIMAACENTTKDYYGLGPFYKANAPTFTNNVIADTNEAGERLIIEGYVRDLECNKVLPNTLIELWHADNSGDYDNTGFNLRAKVYSDENGFYSFETILPGKYTVGSTVRPSHIHFKITPLESENFITQLYFAGDTSIPTDPAASITSGEFNAVNRIINLIQDSNDVYKGYWDIIVKSDLVSGLENDIHLEKGMIYTVKPNPFKEKIEISYSIFKKDHVLLQVFDSENKLISTLVDELQKPKKYNFTWNVNQKLSSGLYYLTLKVNGLQISYKRIKKK